MHLYTYTAYMNTYAGKKTTTESEFLLQGLFVCTGPQGSPVSHPAAQSPTMHCSSDSHNA